MHCNRQAWLLSLKDVTDKKEGTSGEERRYL